MPPRLTNKEWRRTPEGKRYRRDKERARRAALSPEERRLEALRHGRATGRRKRRRGIITLPDRKDP